jgi:hypothetical protein
MKENEHEPELPFNPPLEPVAPEKRSEEGTDFPERPDCTFG